MPQNKYDDPAFFGQYSQMERSVHGLSAAGEWHRLQPMLPDFTGKRVLDLGCGFGWHCAYAAAHGAAQVLGIDISANMLAEAAKRSASPVIQYRQLPIEEYEYPENAFDTVLSSLAFHYLPSFTEICQKVHRTLAPRGDFVFSVEHPVFTAYGNQDWYRDEAGNILHWPVDRYFLEGEREATFLGQAVVKYHRTLTTYLGDLLAAGFEVLDVAEPEPSAEMLARLPEMKDELRRPMMLLVKARRRA